MATQKVSDALIETFPASKITGALPALDGSAVTGAGDSVTKNASDPAIDTNPSDGVGHIWVNTTSGETYACTDATTDNNIWTNLGEGSGNVQAYQFGGTNYAYSAAGWNNGNTDVIERYAFASAVTVQSWGNTLIHDHAQTSIGSTTEGYLVGGSGHPYTQSPNQGKKINKYSFISSGVATDVGDLDQDCSVPFGISAELHGYAVGGQLLPGALGFTRAIQKFAWSSSGGGPVATDVGDAWSSTGYNEGASCSSGFNGYCIGGSGASTRIEKISFSTDVSSQYNGNLITGANGITGGASTTHGYYWTSNTSAGTTQIFTFSFAVEGNSTVLVSELDIPRSYGCGHSSTTHGYCNGGRGGGSMVSQIDRFAFSNDVVQLAIGNLTTPKAYASTGSGAHY